MLHTTGIATEQDLAKVIPAKERLEKGPIAIIECFQEIPCNPCSTACKNGAIKQSADINDRPVIDVNKCNGCGICMSKCPGLAIFVVDETYSDKEALVKIPYEFLPLPEEGSNITGLDREGKPACRVKVIKVLNTRYQDRTPIISLAVPKEYSMVVRSIRLDDYFGDTTMVCRCEEVTLGQIREYIRKGYTSLDELKRISRCGMGPCQGRTCRQLLMQEISAATQTPIAELKIPTFRPPVKPIRMDLLLGGEENE
jgi:Fe-S-cluster-containing hydrogenase component 2